MKRYTKLYIRPPCRGEVAEGSLLLAACSSAQWLVAPNSAVLHPSSCRGQEQLTAQGVLGEYALSLKKVDFPVLCSKTS